MQKDYVVVALGGNAMIRSGERGTFSEQQRNIQTTVTALTNLIQAGHHLVITHGNGPQVGNLLLQQEAASDSVPPMPLEICGAQSQGQIGYMLQQAFRQELVKANLPVEVATIITQVIVNRNSPAFDNPTKFVGPFYDAATAEQLRQEKQWTVVKDSDRGYRRVVPSPKPNDIVEKAIIRQLIEMGVLVIASGGGGVPVVNGEGQLRGVEAVIDKDLVAALLATLLEAQILLILTDADQVALHFGTPQQKNLEQVSFSQMKQYQAEGHFPPGSMGPKIDGALRFIEQGGERVIITRPEQAVAALAGSGGTHIVPD